MSENILDKRKCPLCGNIVASNIKPNYAISYLTTDVTWRCAGCGTEFEADFFYNHRNREVMKGIWEMQPPTAPSRSGAEHNLQWYKDRHQSDCIRINELTVALDTLVDRYANLRKIHGVS